MPVGQVKVIEPLIIGTIKRINVSLGQEVAAGDLLITLDPTADLARLEEIFLTTQIISIRLKKTIEAVQNKTPANRVRLPELEAHLRHCQFATNLSMF